MVELRPAYVWDCPECGLEHFIRCLVPELSDEDYQELREDHGLGPCDTGIFIAMPESVKCKECGLTFKTEQYQ